MPQLWVLQEDQEPAYAVVPLDGGADVYYLSGDLRDPVALGARDGSGWPAYVIRHSGAGGRDRWLLYASGQAPVSINGMNLDLGMRRLGDKDQIRVGASAMFFSTEELPRVVPFPGIGKPCICPRCKQPIVEGTPAVQCPKCGIWHHQCPETELPCWTYGKNCAAALCDYPTAMDGNLQWAPEGL